MPYTVTHPDGRTEMFMDPPAPVVVELPEAGYPAVEDELPAPRLGEDVIDDVSEWLF